jgi:hypothetical protein
MRSSNRARPDPFRVTRERAGRIKTADHRQLLVAQAESHEHISHHAHHLAERDAHVSTSHLPLSCARSLANRATD